MDIRIEFYDTEGFGLVTCPFCGSQENLDASIEDNWDCPKCGKEFWITPARIITETIPTLLEHGFERRTPITGYVPNPNAGAAETEDMDSADDYEPDDRPADDGNDMRGPDGGSGGMLMLW